MTAAYRLRGLGWFGVMVAVILASYLVSARVAAEHKKLDDMDGRIAAAQRDIRALETEFDTRANLVQLEKWNVDTLALAAPTAAQFVSDDATLAALDPHGGDGQVTRAALIVPAMTPTAAPATAPQMAAAEIAAPATPRADDTARTVAPTGRAAPAIARAAEAARGVVAVAKVRPQAVALLDRKLLSDTTFGDIMSGARRESRR